jgi:hypothetical protein
MTEHLWSLATPSHADWEAVSRGGIPDLTAQDVALAAAGLPRIEFLIALYSLAGDDSVRGCVRTYLLEHLLAEREVHQWARRVETLDGQRVAFAEPLVELYLAEERRPSIFQAAPQLRAVALRVEPDEGWSGGAALHDPVAVETDGSGRMALGDWSALGILHNYSGGVRYRNTVVLTAEEAEAARGDGEVTGAGGGGATGGAAVVLADEVGAGPVDEGLSAVFEVGALAEV